MAIRYKTWFRDYQPLLIKFNWDTKSYETKYYEAREDLLNGFHLFSYDDSDKFHRDIMNSVNPLCVWTYIYENHNSDRGRIISQVRGIDAVGYRITKVPYEEHDYIEVIVPEIIR